MSDRLRQLFAVFVFLTPVIAPAQPSYENAFAKEERYIRPTADISRQVERQLQTDAARLSLRLNDIDLRHADIHISDVQREEFYTLLRRIYQFDRRMLDCYNIETTNSPSTDYIRLIYKKDIAWAKPLESGISSTEHPLLNGIFTRYDLIIEKRESLNAQQDALTLRAVNPINMAALASQFHNIEDIEEVELNNAKLARSDIQFKRLRNAWEFQYILRLDEQNISEEHCWTFRVKEDGEVELIDERGVLLPTWIGCE